MEGDEAGRFLPLDSATREMAAVVAVRAYELTKKAVIGEDEKSPVRKGLFLSFSCQEDPRCIDYFCWELP